MRVSVQAGGRDWDLAIPNPFSRVMRRILGAELSDEDSHWLGFAALGASLEAAPALDAGEAVEVYGERVSDWLWESGLGGEPQIELVRAVMGRLNGGTHVGDVVGNGVAAIS